MAAPARQERFFAASKARMVRRGEWARPVGSEAAVGWDSWDPPVDADQVHVVPSLLGITPTSRWRDSAGDLEDEDVLFGGDPADPGPEAGDDDDGNLAEPWTAAQAQEARADAGCTDLEAVLAAAARSGQEAVAAAEAGRSWTEARLQPPVSRVAAARKAPVRKTRRTLASLTRFWHLWCAKDGVVIPTEGPAWEQARRPCTGLCREHVS